MIPKEFQQVGNILMVYTSKGLVPKTIRKIMEIRAKKKGYTQEYIEGLGKEYPRRIYNHAELFVNMNNIIGTNRGLVTALKDGVNIRKVSEVILPMTTKKFAILAPNIPYTEWEKNKISDKAYDLIRNPHRYDYPSLLWWHIVAVFADEWRGKQGKYAEFLQYCYEVTTTCSNASERDHFEHPWYTDFWHLWLNDKYTKVWESD